MESPGPSWDTERERAEHLRELAELADVLEEALDQRDHARALTARLFEELNRD